MATNVVEIETVDFEREEDDLMDEDFTAIDPSPAPIPKVRSAITAGNNPKMTKGRGFREAEAQHQRRLASGGFDPFSSDGGRGPQRSIEGWIVIVSGVHEEAQEEDLYNAFREYGLVKNLHLNFDRRTGFVKGYALVEYEKLDEAQAAITSLDGAELSTQTIHVDWAFSNGSLKRRNSGRSPRGRRSRTPPRRRY